MLARHASAFLADRPTLEQPGFIRFRKRGGEYHANNPDPVIKALHASIGLVVDASDEEDEGPARRPAKAATDAKYADVPAAPTEDQGRVIVLDPEMLLRDRAQLEAAWSKSAGNLSVKCIIA